MPAFLIEEIFSPTDETHFVAANAAALHSTGIHV